MSYMDLKKKILIVEDNPGQQLALYDSIAKAGFLVRKASSGDEGYQQAISSEPDLIIVDKMMPNTNGIDMMNRIRSQSDWGKNVPVLFFSNVSTSNNEEKAALDVIKPIGYLSKSEISLETIIQMIKSVFNEPVVKNAA
jgi:DNA-binding response OmpR family regulator